MSVRRVLMVLSADFGEYVTANIFSRGQLFECRFAVPERLAPFCRDEGRAVGVYADADGLRQIITAARPDVVVLCSGYLFSINGLIDPAALAALVGEWVRAGVAVATTDPWLRVFASNPRARFTIHSVRKGGVDVEATRNVTRLHEVLEALFRRVPHVLAVPLPARERHWLPFFNPDFCAAAEPIGRGACEWVFVLAREDFVFLAGFERERFFGALQARVDELMSVPENQVTFIGPPDLAAFFSERARQWPRVAFVPFCSFAAFEEAIRRAHVVAYWNVLSASLLYCLYHRVPPVFFGTGHQVKVCPELYAHVVEHVYRGRPPALLDPGAPLDPRPGALAARLDLTGWLDAIRRDYERLPTPASVVENVAGRHAIE